MKFRGERMYKLSEMQRGRMYVVVHEEFVDYHSRTPKEQAYALQITFGNLYIHFLVLIKVI